MGGVQSELVATSDVIDIQPTSTSGAENAPRFEVIGERGGITIPAQYRKRHGLMPGTVVLLEEREDGLLLRPAQVIPRNPDLQSDQRTRPTLAELLAGITPENLHEEIDFGPPVGAELL